MMIINVDEIESLKVYKYNIWGVLISKSRCTTIKLGCTGIINCWMGGDMVVMWLPTNILFSVLRPHPYFNAFLLIPDLSDF